MFDNIGEKIKQYARIVCVTGCIIWGIYAIAILDSTEGSPIGFIFCVIMCFFTWVASFPLYGLGELVCNSKRNNELLELLIQQNSQLLHEKDVKERQATYTKREVSDAVNPLPETKKKVSDATNALPGTKRCQNCGAVCNVNFSACDCCGSTHFK